MKIKIENDKSIFDESRNVNTAGCGPGSSLGDSG